MPRNTSMKWELAISPRGGKILVSFLLFLTLIFFFSSKVDGLLLSDEEDELAFFSTKSFSVIYTHSVERTEVVENYRLDQGKLILTDTWFSSYGAGLPATTEYDFEITEDGFHIYNINKIFEEVIYRSGKKLANHRLLIGDLEYKLEDFNSPGQVIIFSVIKLPRWKIYLGGYSKWIEKT